MSATSAAAARPNSTVATARAPRTSGCQEGCAPIAIGGGGLHRRPVGTKDRLGVEQGDQRLEVPEAGGGQECLDDLLLAAPVAGVQIVATLHPSPSPAGQLTGGGRRAVDDRARCPRTAPRRGRGARRRDARKGRACRARAAEPGPVCRRGPPLPRDRRARTRVRRRHRRLQGGSGGSGAPRGTPGTGPWSASRPGCRCSRGPIRLRRTQVSCTASSASVREPSMR